VLPAGITVDGGAGNSAASRDLRIVTGPVVAVQNRKEFLMQDDYGPWDD
jgi:hypothetical protein